VHSTKQYPFIISNALLASRASFSASATPILNKMSHQALSKPRLTYFAGRGLAEIPRLVLAQAGVDYEDVRISDISSIKDQQTFGQVPSYEEPTGFRLNQSGAISRYIAASHGLYGSNVKESALIDQILDGLGDVRGKLNQQYALPEGDARDAFKKKWAAETLPLWVGYFERLLKKNNGGAGFFVGDKLSLADIAVYHYFWTQQQENAAALKEAPLLTAFVERIASQPKIAAWLKVRPVSPW